MRSNRANRGGSDGVGKARLASTGGIAGSAVSSPAGPCDWPWHPVGTQAGTNVSRGSVGGFGLLQQVGTALRCASRRHVRAFAFPQPQPGNTLAAQQHGPVSQGFGACGLADARGGTGSPMPTRTCATASNPARNRGAAERIRVRRCRIGGGRSGWGSALTRYSSGAPQTSVDRTFRRGRQYPTISRVGRRIRGDSVPCGVSAISRIRVKCGFRIGRCVLENLPKPGRHGNLRRPSGRRRDTLPLPTWSSSP